ncbi:MAG: hypothetical protein KAH32_01110 [Chlamydiia bacterium]|nr:hypothetical protein [Chlamydiia bacterium]
MDPLLQIEADMLFDSLNDTNLIKQMKLDEYDEHQIKSIQSKINILKSEIATTFLCTH